VIVYEVNLYPQAAIEAEYRRWLDAHVREMRALPGFLGAELFERRDPAAPAGELALCVQYRLRDSEALEAYFRDHAPRLRAEGIAHFGDRFRAERRVLASLARY